MSIRRTPRRSAAQAEASRRNGKRSKGPATREGRARSSMSRFKHGLYCKPDEATRELMLCVEEDPNLLVRLEAQFREALQPANAMEAMIVADIARLYRDKEVLENGVRRARWQLAQYAGRQLFPYATKDYQSRLVPGNQLWGAALDQQARINRQIEAKLNLLLRLKKKWAPSNMEPEAQVEDPEVATITDESAQEPSTSVNEPAECQVSPEEPADSITNETPNLA